jgi:hypothetical protein
LKAEKTTDKATTNDCLLDFDEKQEDTVGANNNNVVEDKNDEELKALKKFLREVKLGGKCYALLFIYSHVLIFVLSPQTNSSSPRGTN